MTHPRARALLASLPGKVRTPLERALAVDGEAGVKAADKALDAAGVEYGPILQLVEGLTPLQRTVAELLAYRELRIVNHGVPAFAEARRRWLGLDPPGPLERVVDFRHEGEPPRVPLWRVFFVLREDRARLQQLVKALKLPLLERLEMFAEINRDPYGFYYTVAAYFPWGTPRELERQPPVTRWASALADRIVAARSTASGWWCAGSVGRDLRELLFHALLAGKVTLQPEWDQLVPVAFAPLGLAKRVLAALPVGRRGPASVAMLDWHMSSGKVALGLELLAAFPSPELVDLIVKHAGEVDHLPRRETMKKLAAIAKKNAVVSDRLSPSAMAPPTLKLTVAKSIRPQQVDDLTPLQQQQLVIAGSWYDGKRWPAAVRLGHAIPRGRNPERFAGSFGGWLEVRELVDDTGRPAYTALLYLVDSGTVFKAGTTDVVASIVQSSIDRSSIPASEPALHEALQPVIQAKLPKQARKKR